MAMFGMKKNKPSEGSDLILAYLEEAQRLRVPLTILDHHSREVPAALTSVMEDKIAVAPQGTLMGERGATFRLLFILDGLRFKATTRLIEIRPGSALLEVPSDLALAERRKKPRARLNAREGATVTALTGLFDGVGINGSVENISETGLCIRVDRAMDVKTQRKMHLSGNLLDVGQPFMVIKLSKLPKCPTIELAGTVAYVDARQGVLIGVLFEPGKDGLLAPIRSLVSSRTSAIPAQVPPKARRQVDPDREAEGSSPSGSSRKPSQGIELPPEPPARAPEPAPQIPAPAPLVEPEAPAPADDRSQALLRVKKRSRTLLLAMPPGPAREEVAAFLIQDGYGRVLSVDTLTELLSQIERPDLHLILVDGGVAELQGLALASLLRRAMEDAMPPVILAETEVDAELVLGAQETGVAQILVKPYELDADFRHLVEEHLGL
jgi:CheY-like chemotaxis protein